MRLSRTCLILVLTFLAVNNDAKFNFARKKTTVLKFETCPGQKISTVNCTVNKYNRTAQMFDIDLNVAEDLDDTKVMQFELRRWADGGWKHNFIRIEKYNFCKTIFEITPMGCRRFLTDAGREPKCPIKKGHLRARNVSLNFSDTPVGVMTGRFMAIIKGVNEKKETFICGELVFDIEEY